MTITLNDKISQYEMMFKMCNQFEFELVGLKMLEQSGDVTKVLEYLEEIKREISDNRTQYMFEALKAAKDVLKAIRIDDNNSFYGEKVKVVDEALEHYTRRWGK